MWVRLIANHLTNHYDQPIRNTELQLAPIYCTLFLEVHNCVARFTSHGKIHKFGAEEPISCAKLVHIDNFTINFTVWSHILGTVRDALRPKSNNITKYSFGSFGL
jgi:hypothetical protein